MISECRVGLHGYCYEYQYDQGGNRLWKIKKDPNQPTVVLEKTRYHYDVEDPPYYLSGSNRLMYYDVFEGTMVLKETVYYVYQGINENFGNPSVIIRRQAGSMLNVATQFAYTKSGEVWLIGKRQWLDNQSCIPSQLLDLDITEVRGSGRARYLYRKRQTGNIDFVDQTRPIVWSDYDGDQIYADYTVAVNGAASQPTPMMAYLPGVGQVAAANPPAIVSPVYYHTDQIGSLRVATDGSGNLAGRFVYTAFGELVYSDGGSPGTSAPATRYQYGGAWGYETLPDVPFLHVGHRWYDPSTGRFLQRDPIGVDGGLNVYEYVGGDPLSGLDPYGLDNPFGPINPGPPMSNAELFLWWTGGVDTTFCDRWGDRLAARQWGPGPQSAGGIIMAGRVPKGGRIPGQTGTTSAWRRIFGRAGAGGAGKVVAGAGIVGLAVSTCYDILILAQEGIYAGAGIHPGEYPEVDWNW